MADLGTRILSCAAGCAMLVGSALDASFHVPAITTTGVVLGAILGISVVLVDKARST